MQYCVYKSTWRNGQIFLFRLLYGTASIYKRRTAVVRLRIEFPTLQKTVQVMYVKGFERKGGGERLIKQSCNQVIFSQIKSQVIFLQVRSQISFL